MQIVSRMQISRLFREENYFEGEQEKGSLLILKPCINIVVKHKSMLINVYPHNNM